MSKLTSKRKPFKPNGVVTGLQPTVYRTALYNFCMESTVTTTQGAPVAEGVPEEDNAITKNDRDRITPITGNRLHVHSSRRFVPGKIWMPTNQIRAIPADARVDREVRVRALQTSRGI